MNPSQPNNFFQKNEENKNSPFGGQASNIFGGQSSAPFGNQPSNLFGGQQSNLFGNQQAAPFSSQPNAPFGGQQSNLFGNQSATPFNSQSNAPFGGQQTNLSNQPNSSLFGGQSSTPFGGQTTNLTAQPSTSLGGQTSTPFGVTPSAPFGGQTTNLFGAQPSTSFGGQTSTPFGGQQNNPVSNSSNPFGTQTAAPFSSQPAASFNTQQTTSAPFGAANASTLGSANATASVTPQTDSTTSTQQQSIPLPFGATPTPICTSNTAPTTQPSAAFGSNASQPSLFQPSNSLFDTTQQVTEDKSTQQNLADQSSLMSSIKDNSLNLYNLTLQEIIDRHSAILDANIKTFKSDAQAVFEKDLKLIRSKNNYLEIQKKLSEETLRLDELSQVLDFFETKLADMETKECSDGAKIVKDFEDVCSKFYEKIDSFKDEQDDVLGLVNENYEIIENIDKKLDMLSQIRNLNK